MIDWKDKRWAGKKGSQLFEELCFDILELEGYKNVRHLIGSSDTGRDIEANKTELEPDGKERIDKYWFQCKLYKSGIGLKAISDSILNAQNYNINFLVIMTNSHITPPLKDHITKANRNKQNGFRIYYIEGKDIDKKMNLFWNKIDKPDKYISKDLLAEKKKYLPDNLINKLKINTHSHFNVKEENEFNYLYNQYSKFPVTLEIDLSKETSHYFLPRTHILLKYSINLVDFLIAWLQRDPMHERIMSIKNNSTIIINDIFNDEITGLIADKIKINGYRFKEIKLKNFPILDLNADGLVKFVDHSYIILGIRIDKFYRWLKYYGKIKEKLKINFEERINFNRK